MNRFILLIVLFVGISGCTFSNQAPLITKETAVERTSAIVIARITFVDRYNDPELMENQEFESSELLKDKEVIAARRSEIGSTRLRAPLYYLADFRLILEEQENEEGENYVISRFNQDLNEYEDIAIHAIKPGTFKWQKLEMDQFRFDASNTQDSPVRWQRFLASYSIPYPQWKFESGKIYYIGDIRFYFKTKKFAFGLVPRENVVEKIELSRILIEDRYEELKEQISKEKSWFPVNEIISQVNPKEFILKEKELVEGKYEDPEKIKEVQRDTSKYFF